MNREEILEPLKFLNVDKRKGIVNYIQSLEDKIVELSKLKSCGNCYYDGQGSECFKCKRSYLLESSKIRDYWEIDTEHEVKE